MSWIPPSPKTPEELLALPVLGYDEPIYAIRATDEGAVYFFIEDGKRWCPVFANDQWWRREVRL